MSTTHLIHGFNVSDGGRGTVKNLKPFFKNPHVHSIGLIGLIDLKWKNKEVVQELYPLIGPDDVLVGHSNGALIIWRLIQAGARPKAVILFNAALRRDVVFPEDVPVLNMHSRFDWIVQLGRIWSRLITKTGIRRHGWGAAGRYGFTKKQVNVTNFDMGDRFYTHQVKGHSDALKPPKVEFWGRFAANWLKRISNEPSSS